MNQQLYECPECHLKYQDKEWEKNAKRDAKNITVVIWKLLPTQKNKKPSLRILRGFFIRLSFFSYEHALMLLSTKEVE